MGAANGPLYCLHGLAEEIEYLKETGFFLL